MSDEELRKLRNFGIVAHIDAGKTTTTERMLYYSGRIHRIGEVDDGSAWMDWMDLEQERGITITSAATFFTWKDYSFNLIDTPGHVDFTAEVERSLRVLDGAIGIFCGVGGVEPQSETVWHQAERYRIPRIAYVNKLDRIGADFYDVLKQMREKLASKCLPVQLPIGVEEEFVGIIDLVELKAYIWDKVTDGLSFRVKPIPKEYEELVSKYRTELLEEVSLFDESLLDKYLAGNGLTPGEIKKLVRKGTLDVEIFPVLCGSSLKNKGIQPLLNAIIDYLPSPSDIPDVEGIDPATGKKVYRKRAINENFSALVFKVYNQGGKGRLTYLRVYSGKAKEGDLLFAPDKKMKVKLPTLVKMHADKRERVDRIQAGDIVVMLGNKTLSTGDTLCPRQAQISFEGMMFPEPVISMALEPESLHEQKKLLEALELFQSEDPTFRFKIDQETNQLIISGMGELHLEVLIERLKRENNLKVRAGSPQVSYRESITKPIRETHTFNKTIGGEVNKAGVSIYIEPGERGSGYKYMVGEKASNAAEELLEAAKEVLIAGRDHGIMYGYPIVDMTVILEELITYESQTTPLAVKSAASNAFRQACIKADPILLEPTMMVDVIAPKEFLGEIINSLSLRGGDIKKITERKMMQSVRAEVPLAKMFGYTTALRSITQGRGTYTMEVAGFTPTELKNE